MLFGVGCDLCEIARMEQSLFGPHGEAFEARVFGEAERQALALDSCREAPKKAKNDHGDTVRQSAASALTSPSATRAAWRWPSACWKPDLLLRIQWNSPRVHTGRRCDPY